MHPAEQGWTDLRATPARFHPALRVTPKPKESQVSAGVRRNLILAYRPGWQSLADLETIARHIHELDPTIGVHIVASTIKNTITRKAAARLPTLVVSTGRMPIFKPARGKVYQGLPLPKLEELRRLHAAGVPVPRTAILTPQLVLDPALWGPFVILKPTDIATSSHGRGIQLMRTERVRYIAPHDYPADHPGRLGPMFVQQYVDTGDRVRSHRITTLFGEPLMALLHSGEAQRVDLDAPDEVLEAAPVAIQGAGARHTEFIDAPDAVALARAAHAAIPEVPLKGCDILRDVRTGRLYVIELNCGGNVWHFSSNFLAKRRREHGPEFELQRHQQFDALRTAARVLVERTIAEAE
jgi:hypothetical protein